MSETTRKPFQFGAGIQGDSSTPDGTVVGRVRTQRQRDEAGQNDFMAMLVKAFERMLGGQQGRETTDDQLRALRNDPVGDYNKQRQDPRNPEFGGFGPGGNRADPEKGVVGPVTDKLGFTPEMIARMQGRTARNQWKFPEMFRADDQRAVGNVMKEHQQGIDYIKGQQAGVVPTTDFRQANPNMAGQYEGTNVRDFLLSEADRRGQAKADGFDPAPAGAVRSIIPKAQYGNTPGYATRGPASKPGNFSFPKMMPNLAQNDAPTVPPSPNSAHNDVPNMFGANSADNSGVYQLPPMTAFQPKAAVVPPGRLPSYTVGPDGQKYGRNGRPNYGPQFEDIMKFFLK